MNPWWLRPPADEEPAKQKKPSKPAPESKAAKPIPETRDKRPSDTEEQAASSGSRRSGRGRGGRRRRTPDAKGQRGRSRASRIAIFLDASWLGYDQDAEAEGQVDTGALMRRLQERGRIVVRRLYGDVSKVSERRADLRQAAIEVVDLEGSAPTTRAESLVRMAIDVLELSLSDDACEIVVLVSNDAGLKPLVDRLREAKVEVVGIGDRRLAGEDLVARYSHFFDFSELAEVEPPAAEPPAASSMSVPQDKELVFAALAETIRSLESGSDGVIWGSVLKQEMRRRLPGMELSGLGYTTFTDLLEDAERHEVICLERDDRSGTYYVTGLVGQ